MNRRITVRGIIEKDGMMFAQRLKKGDGEADFWCTPGGGLDPQESIYDGLVREMVEETGVTPKIGKLLYVQQYNEEDCELIEFFFHITNAADYESIDLAATSHGEIEVSQYGFIDLKQEYVLPRFLSEVDIVSDVNSNAPKFFEYL